MTRNSTDEKRPPFESARTFTLAGPAMAEPGLMMVLLGISSSAPVPECLNSTLGQYGVFPSSLKRVKEVAVVDRVKTCTSRDSPLPTSIVSVAYPLRKQEWKVAIRFVDRGKHNETEVFVWTYRM
jgi:hypothetical protein